MTPSSECCEECLNIGSKWVHLRLCLTCGKVGCCESSPKRHASKHSHAAGHPIVQSFEPGENWIYCFVDDVAMEPAEPIHPSAESLRGAPGGGKPFRVSDLFTRPRMAPRAGTSSILSAWVALVLLSACTSDGLLDGLPSASAQVARAECPSVELVLPDGSEPVLRGTWIGIGQRNAVPWPGVYEFNLLNSCVSWVGRSAEEGEEVGARWTNVFLGTVNPDFTISGDWAVVSSSEAYCETGTAGALCDRARGTLILRVESDPADASRIRLVLRDVTKIGVGDGGIGDFVTGIWVRPGDEDLFDLPVN